jgi:hypothetical protein
MMIVLAFRLIQSSGSSDFRPINFFGADRHIGGSARYNLGIKPTILMVYLE